MVVYSVCGVDADTGTHFKNANLTSNRRATLYLVGDCSAGLTSGQSRVVRRRPARRSSPVFAPSWRNLQEIDDGAGGGRSIDLPQRGERCFALRLAH